MTRYLPRKEKAPIGQDAVVGNADSENIELVSKRVKGVE